MKLFILLNPFVIKIIGSCSNNARVAPLPNMKRNGNIFTEITHPGMRIIVSRKLYELFSTIKKHAAKNHKKCIFPIQGALNKSQKTYAQDTQRKKVPPDEFQRFPCFVQNELYVIHRLYSLNCYQNSTNFIKITLQKITSKNEEKWCIQAFQKKESTAQGVKIHEL